MAPEFQLTAASFTAGINGARCSKNVRCAFSISKNVGRRIQKTADRILLDTLT